MKQQDGCKKSIMTKTCTFVKFSAQKKHFENINGEKKLVWEIIEFKEKGAFIHLDCSWEKMQRSTSWVHSCQKYDVEMEDAPFDFLLREFKGKGILHSTLM